MSVREFAAHLGVSDRMVSKWESGGTTIRPRPINQAALDTSLARASADVKARFAAKSGRSTARFGIADGTLPIFVAKHLVAHPVDGRLMTLVEGGPCVVGHNREPRWVPGFYVDLYPVTNADYRRFVDATGHRVPPHWTGGRCPEPAASHPVAMVSRDDAQAYARWAAKALPTSAQWEKAARGVDGLTYPWGDVPDPARCNVRRSGIGGTTPADWFDNGASPYGVLDLCGNVWEWCDTRTHVDRSELKGGSFVSSLDRATPAAFYDAPDDLVSEEIGFRCVAEAITVLELLSI